MRKLIPLVALGTILAAPARAAEPLVDVPFAVGAERLFDESRNDGRYGDQGRWDLIEGRLVGDVVRLRFLLEPPSHDLPVDPGPAVLFGGLRLWGDAGGDMGASEAVDSLTSLVVEPCVADPCTLTTFIDLPIDDLRPAIRRLEKRASLKWVSAELTLVRTFGDGTWLQVLPFDHSGDGMIGSLTGRLGAIESTNGRLFRYGLFPTELASPIGHDPILFPGGLDYAREVDRLRREAGDATRPMRSAPGDLRLTIDPPCQGSPAVTMHNESGDRIFDSPLHGVTAIDERLGVPVSIPWWLTVHDGGGFEYDQLGGFGVRVGPVVTSGAPVAIDASFDCSGPIGSLRVDGLPVQSLDPAPTAAATPEAAVLPLITPFPSGTSDGSASSPGRLQDLGRVIVLAALVLGFVIATALMTRPRRS